MSYYFWEREPGIILTGNTHCSVEFCCYLYIFIDPASLKVTNSVVPCATTFLMYCIFIVATSF